MLEPARSSSTIRSAFLPLGIVAKVFGLFPCFDLSFTESLSTRKLRLIHALDYVYSGLLFLLMGGGATACSFSPPMTITAMMEGNEELDFYVIMSLFYMNMLMGVMSLFIFPTKFPLLLHYIQHFSGVDGSLGLRALSHQKETRFGKRLLLVLLLYLLLLTLTFYFQVIAEMPEEVKPVQDYLIIPLEVLAGMSRVIPSSLLLFFMNSIRIRLTELNHHLAILLQPLTPSNADSFNMIPGQNTKVFGGDLETLRILHEELQELAEETSRIFGSHLVRDFLYSILGIILYAYFILFLREDNLIFWFIYPLSGLLILISLLVISSYAHFITIENNASLRLLQKVSILHLTPESNEQIRSFVKKLDKPMIITAAGYFTINRKLVTSILGAIMTYFVILVQFKLADPG